MQLFNCFSTSSGLFMLYSFAMCNGKAVLNEPLIGNSGTGSLMEDFENRAPPSPNSCCCYPAPPPPAHRLLTDLTAAEYSNKNADIPKDRAPPQHQCCFPTQAYRRYSLGLIKAINKHIPKDRAPPLRQYCSAPAPQRRQYSPDLTKDSDRHSDKNTDNPEDRDPPVFGTQQCICSPPARRQYSPDLTKDSQESTAFQGALSDALFGSLDAEGRSPPSTGCGPPPLS